MRPSSEALLQVALFLRRSWREQLLVSPLSSEGLILGKLIPSPVGKLLCRLARRGEVGLFRVARRRQYRAVVSTKLWLDDSEAFVCSLGRSYRDGALRAQDIADVLFELFHDRFP